MSDWLCAVTRSRADHVIASCVEGPCASTPPVVIFSKGRRGGSPDINARATILVAIVGIEGAITSIMMARQEQRREGDAQMALAANQQMIESVKKG